MKRAIAFIFCASMILFFAGCIGSDYKSAVSLAENGNWVEAKEIFTSLGSYQDSADKVRECDYHIAEEAMNSGAYEEAVSGFEVLGDYLDAAEKIRKCNYIIALDAMDAENWDKAISGFEALGDFSDSEALLKECQYGKAQKLLSEGGYSEAKELFSGLGAYKDSATMVSECRYQAAVKLYEEEKYEEALEAFLTLPNYGETDRYTVLTMLRTDQQKFMDIFAAGMDNMFSAEGIQLELTEVSPGSKGDARTFYIDRVPGVRSVILKFAHQRPDGMTTSDGQINSIKIIADTYYEETLDYLYIEALCSAVVMMCVLDDRADPDIFAELVDGEIGKLWESITEENDTQLTEFEYDGYDCVASLLVWPGEAYHICIEVLISELIS